MDGLEATRRIVAGNDSPRVLMLTTFDLDEYVFDALVAGASGFLLKDVAPEDLLAGIHIISRGDSLLSPSVTRRLIDRSSVTTPASRSHRPVSTSSPRASSRSSGSSPAACPTPRSPNSSSSRTPRSRHTWPGYSTSSNSATACKQSYSPTKPASSDPEPSHSASPTDGEARRTVVGGCLCRAGATVPVWASRSSDQAGHRLLSVRSCSATTGTPNPPAARHRSHRRHHRQAGRQWHQHLSRDSRHAPGRRVWFAVAEVCVSSGADQAVGAGLATGTFADRHERSGCRRHACSSIKAAAESAQAAGARQLVPDSLGHARAGARRRRRRPLPLDACSRHDVVVAAPRAEQQRRLRSTAQTRLPQGFVKPGASGQRRARRSCHRIRA